MKKAMIITNSTVLIIVMAIGLFSCNKEGPQGIEGPAGISGTVGAVGPAGKAGSTFLKGKVAPNNNTGNTGDYYLDESSGSLYGPKTNDGWGSPYTFSGNEGGKMYGGSSMPDKTFGLKGDFYLDTAGYTLYGPKQSDQQWGPGIYLNGSGGNTGVTEYVINNPNSYFTNGIGDIRYNFYLALLNDDNNNFNLWKQVNEKHALIEVYLKQKFITFNDNGDSIGFHYSISPARGPLNTNFYYHGDDLVEGNYETIKDGLYIYFQNYNCDCSSEDFLPDLKANLGLTSVMIYVISPTAVNSIAPPAPPRSSTSFNDNADGWTISGDAKGSVVDASYSNSGGVSGGYVYAKDDVIEGTWYFKAPASYLGRRLDYYGATLSFSLFQHSAMTNQFEAADIILESGYDRIVCQLPKHPDGAWTNYNIKISTDADWRDQNYNGAVTRQRDIENILGDLTGLYIRGEYETGPDSGGLDNVQIKMN